MKISKKAYGTHYSRVVPHHSTNWAQGSLTSEFGWDLVYPTWYDRMTGEVFELSIHFDKQQGKKQKIAATGDRTWDLQIFSLTLSQLSYSGCVYSIDARKSKK